MGFNVLLPACTQGFSPSLAPRCQKTRAWMAIVHVVLAEDAHGLFLSAGIKSFSQQRQTQN
jgi:hypothetical protein